jgi:hypothetical protein
MALARDPEEWAPVFGKDHAQNKNLERDDDSKKNHPALGMRRGGTTLADHSLSLRITAPTMLE